MGLRVRLDPDRQLVREVADCLLLAFTEQQVWIVPNVQTIAEVPREVTTLVH